MRYGKLLGREVQDGGESRMGVMVPPKVHLEMPGDLLDCYIQSIGGG